MLIAETRVNLERGYALAPQGGVGVNLCVGGSDNGVGLGLCTGTGTTERAVAIDAAAERRKLAGLESRAAALRAAAARDLTACSR